MKHLKLFESFPNLDKPKMVNKFLLEWTMIKVLEKERLKLEPVKSINRAKLVEMFTQFHFDNNTTIWVDYHSFTDITDKAIEKLKKKLSIFLKLNEIFILALLTKRLFSKETTYNYLFKNALWHLYIKNNPSGEYILRN